MHLAKLMTVLSVCILLCGSPLSFHSGSTVAIAQPPTTVEADRPTQRWLPLPQGDGADLSEQAQLLQQLRDLISSEAQNGASDRPLPKLTEEQLREMEKALESVRDLIGEDKLPNLESIPKEWIDQALSDPVLRKQAQQLLEQYARDRKLPLPSDRTPRNSEGAPFPRRPSDKSSDKSSQNPKSNSKAPQNNRSNTSPKPPANSSQTQPELFPPVEDPFSNSSDSNPTVLPDSSRTSESPRSTDPSGKKNKATRGSEPDQGTGEQQEQPEDSRSSTSDSGKANPSGTRSPDRPLPTRPDAERIEALQELFKKLKTIEGQRTPAQNVPSRNPGSTNSYSPNQPGSNSNNNLRSTIPTPPRNQTNPAMPPRARSGNQPPLDSSNAFAPPNSPDSTKDASGIDPYGTNPYGTNPYGTEPSDLNNPNTPDSSSGKSAQSRFLEIEKQLAEQRKEAAKRLQGSTLPRSNSPSSNSAGNNQNFGPNGTRANSTDRTRNGVPGKSTDANSQTGSGYVMQDAELRTQLERQGLGRALQSIVEKTMKEQGESNPAASQQTGKSSSAQPKSKDGLADNRSQSTTLPAPPPSSTASRPTPKVPDAFTKKNAPAAAPSVPSVNQNANSPSMSSGWRDTAAQFWGAIRSTPGESGGSSARPPSISSGGLGNYGFVWNGQAWLVLGLVLVLCAVLLLLARKRVVLASAAKEAEAELAKEILTEGIRTRADVVRAFHRFVLRRAQPVANWWNHRYVAAKLSDASPQLRSVISDLASVYEHARYLPPEVKLSSEEIDRVQAALKQCAASGA